MRSWNDYILGTHIRLFQKIAVRDARRNTDHYIVLGCLCRAAHVAHYRCLGRRTCLSMRPPSTPDKADHMFADFQQAILSPHWWERHRQAWISPETSSRINARIEARRCRDKRSSRYLVCTVKARIQGERRRRAATIFPV